VQEHVQQQWLIKAGTVVAWCDAQRSSSAAEFQLAGTKHMCIAFTSSLQPGSHHHVMCVVFCADTQRKQCSSAYPASCPCLLDSITSTPLFACICILTVLIRSFVHSRLRCRCHHPPAVTGQLGRSAAWTRSIGASWCACTSPM
jgi:hypothetical protein